MILFGFQHCGKSTLGAKLASHLGLPHIDTDWLISEKVGDQKKLWRESPKRFREVEKEVVRKLLPGGIISLGGGTILEEENRKQLAKIGPFYYLKISKERLKKRYKDPLFFEEIYQKRLPLYEAIEATWIDMDQSDEEILWQATR